MRKKKIITQKMDFWLKILKIQEIDRYVKLTIQILGLIGNLLIILVYSRGKNFEKIVRLELFQIFCVLLRLPKRQQTTQDVY